MGRWLAAISAMAALALPAPAGAAELSSGFDAGDEGWRVSGNSVSPFNVAPPEWVPDGGNPGGYVRVADGSQEHFAQLEAPPAWTGDLSANYGGSIALDVRHAEPDTGPTIQIQSFDNGFLFYPHRPPSSGWRTQSAPLTETDPCWSFIPPGGPSGPVQPRAPTQAEFQAVLAEVDLLSIGVELGFAQGDVGEFDNIRLSETPSPTSVGCGPPPDVDGDLVPDEFDACPTQAGFIQFGGCPPPAPPEPPGGVDCVMAKEKLAKAKEKLKEAEGKRAKQKARAKVKKAKQKVKEACAA